MQISTILMTTKRKINFKTVGMYKAWLRTCIASLAARYRRLSANYIDIGHKRLVNLPLLLCPRPRGIKRRCAYDVWRLSVCRVDREYSWRPQLLEARRAGRRRPGVRRVWAGAGQQRAAYMGGAYRAASRAHLVMRITRRSHLAYTSGIPYAMLHVYTLHF